MSDKYILTECLTQVNKHIQQPLKQSHRIRFTSFDVSQNYIIFGATSGGIYIFTRNPCEFIKLVPSKEGAVYLIAISLDEKLVAISSTKGLIVIIENCFNEANIKYQIFSEHEGKLITAIKWYFNELYCGDNAGKVSVISLTSILSKAIFQTPTAVLMHLDSSVIQLDIYSKFLLVSTKTKTFLCDTEEEQYRQIGKKLRDGEFGACFYADKPQLNVKLCDKEKSIFKVLKDDEKFSSQDVDGVKIFCARPGLRIWEANFEASVVCTYQFKSTISENCTEIIHLDSKPNSRLNLSKIVSGQDVTSFGKICVALNKFLVTFSSNNILIFNINGVKLLFKYNKCASIKEIKIFNNYIYVWDKGGIKILALMDLEFLIMKTLARKQFYLCSEICVKYNEDLIKLLETSEKVYALSILKDKLKGESIFEEITPILGRIKESKINGNGIVKVENGHIEEAGCSYDYAKKFTQKAEIKIIDPTLDPNYIINILYRQYKVNKMYSNIETPQLYNILESRNLEEIIVLFKEFKKHVEEMNIDDNNVELWCYKQYLKYVKEKYSIRDLEIDSMALKYIFDAFKSVNKTSDILSCDCTFPLPLVKNFKVEFYDTGCDLYKKLTPDELNPFLTSVPYMWKFSLSEFKDVNSSLPLLVQFSDCKLLKETSTNFNYDIWEDMLRLLIKIKKNICLNCEKRIKFDASFTISWKDFALTMLRSIGARGTIKLLQRYSKFIPNRDLGHEFYQTCMFSEIMGENKKTCELSRAIFEDAMLGNQLEIGLKQYLNNKYVGGISIKEFNKFNIKCSMCDLLLRSPILEDLKLSCGHEFHKICVDSNKGLCCICVQSK